MSTSSHQIDAPVPAESSTAQPKAPVPAEMEVFARRRQAYMDAIGNHAVALLRSPPESIRNGDVHHPFRQSSDLYYLTGFAEPEATLILRPGAAEEKVILFVRPRDPEAEVWDGRRAGIEGAKAYYGADAAYPASELNDRLLKLLANHQELYYSVGLDADFDRKVAAAIATMRMRERKGLRPPRAIIDPWTVLHELRLRKSPEEVALLRKAAEISAEAHIEAMKAARPGMNEYELEALVNFIFRRRGGSGPGYNTIVGSGENATILHHIENNRVFAEDDLVLIDAGCEYRSYTADITRTFPVSGRFSDAQRRVYEVVLAVQKEAVAMTRPGTTIDKIHEHCVERLTAGMIELGLLQGTVKERIDDASYKRFYMHRTSHWLGMDVHDVGAYTHEGECRPLEPGMIITIEPGLYISANAQDVPEQYKGIGVRIEDDVLVTESGHEVLTSAVPKEIAEIEALRRQ